MTDGVPSAPASIAWNAFGAYCQAAGKFYAVYPQLKANTLHDLYFNLSFEQFWVFTQFDIVPGVIGPGPAWKVEKVAYPNPVPKN